MGLLQGVTELFPVSSLGHSVLLPGILGWHNIVTDQSASESNFLAFLVGLHVATAIALLIFYRRIWAKIIKAFFESIRKHKAETPHERLAWQLIISTVIVGLIGVLTERKFRILFAKPLAAAIFLTVNGLILLAGEWYRRQALKGRASLKLSTLSYRDGAIIGTAQSFAFLAGISRSGVTMVAGLIRGLNHEDAANFSFLLATPVILGAGVYKLHDFLGPNGNGVRGQILVGSLVAGIAAYFSVKFLTRYFQTKTLTPFAIYCLVIGIIMTIHFA